MKAKPTRYRIYSKFVDRPFTGPVYNVLGYDR